MCKLSRNRAKTSVFCKFLPDYDVYEDHPITSPSIDSGEAEVTASIVRGFEISVNGKCPQMLYTISSSGKMTVVSFSGSCWRNMQ